MAKINFDDLKETFKELRPHHWRGSFDKYDSVVKVSYTNQRGYKGKPFVLLRLWFGGEVMKLLNIQAGDRVSFGISPLNQRHWRIQKAEPGRPGYKLMSPIKGVKVKYLWIAVTWTATAPAEAERKQHAVKYDIYEENGKPSIIIYADREVKPL